MGKLESKAIHQDAEVGLRVLVEEIAAGGANRDPERADRVTVAITKVEAALHELDSMIQRTR